MVTWTVFAIAGYTRCSGGTSVHLYKETDKEGKKKGVSMERSKRALKREVLTAYHNLIKIQQSNIIW